MKEFSFQYNSFQKGISPSDVQLRNVDILSDALNVKASKLGIMALPYTRHIEAASPYAWPWPQVFKSTNGALMIVDDMIGDFNTSNLTMTQFSNMYPGSSYTFSEQACVADFGLHMVFSRPTENGPLYRAYAYYGGGYDWYWYSHNAQYSPWSVCNFRGQLIEGGLGSGDYKHWVAWSRIGGVEYMKAMTDIRVYGEQMWWAFGPHQFDYNTSAGNRHMEWGGQVYKVKPLHKGVAVYGENGVSILIPAASPVPTFGLLNLPCPGVIGRDAITGDLETHWFIDKDGYVWAIGNDFKPNKLGYNKIFTGKTNMIGHFDSALRDVYFGDSTVCYLLADGLTRLDTRPSSILREGSTLFMFYPYGGLD